MLGMVDPVRLMTPRARLREVVIRRLDALEANLRSKLSTSDPQHWTRDEAAKEVRAIRWHVLRALEDNERGTP